ncbi:hypothetical protein HK405_014823, partial [Cladochytrium tenue]
EAADAFSKTAKDVVAPAEKIVAAHRERTPSIHEHAQISRKGLNETPAITGRSEEFFVRSADTNGIHDRSCAQAAAIAAAAAVLLRINVRLVAGGDQPTTQRSLRGPINLVTPLQLPLRLPSAPPIPRLTVR